MGASFRVELEELEQARSTLQGLLDDVFNDTASAIHPVTLQNNTASSIQQGHYAGNVYKMASMDGGQSSTNFGPTDQGIQEINALNQAHGAAHAAILALVADLNNQINLLNERAAKTHQVYSQTEDSLQVGVVSIQKNM